MGVLVFSGYFLLGLGPAVVLFATLIARKSFLIILTLASAFLWLVTLMLTALIVRGFTPLPDTASSYVFPIVVGVTVQELLRPLTYRGYRAGLVQLDLVAGKVGAPSLSVLDRFSLVLATGYGHGVAHSVFFFLSFLPASMSRATYYVDSCPQASLFMFSAISSLAFLTMHTFGMVVAYVGYERGHAALWLSVPLAHYAASLLTLANFAQGGCMVTMPALWAIAVLVGVCSAWLFLNTGGHPFSLQRALMSQGP